MTDIPSIPLDRDRFVDINDGDSIGKIVIARVPEREGQEGCLGMVIRRPPPSRDPGVAFLTGPKAGMALYKGHGLTELYAVDVTDLVVLTIVNASATPAYPSKSLDIAAATRAGQKVYAVPFNTSDDQTEIGQLVVYDPGTGTVTGGFPNRSDLTHLATVGRLGVQWKLS